MSEEGSSNTSRTSGEIARAAAVPPPHIPDHELLRCIGEGSYGQVWLARNVMGEARAVKIVCRAKFREDDHAYQSLHKYVR